MKGLSKLALEVGPLAVFFIVNGRYGIFTATGVFMGVTVAALFGSVVVLRRIPIMPLVTAACVLVFGGLTLYLQNEMFIKMKPTVINLLFAAALGVGLMFNRSLMKVALGEVIHMSDEGWRILTVRWTGFFIALAVANELVWRFFSTEVWAAFKLFGVMPISMMFMMSQIGLLQKYQLEQEAAEPAEK